MSGLQGIEYQADPTEVSAPSTKRQQHGLACEECRKRKSRCDRRRPQCGLCAEIGIPCITATKRPQRGPKKGQLQTLRNRVVVLEQQLAAQSLSNNLYGTSIDNSSSAIEPALIYDPDQVFNWDRGRAVNQHEESVVRQPSQLELSLPESSSKSVSTLLQLDDSLVSLHSSPESVSTLPIMPTFSALGDLEKRDLLQLYFDRVHPFVPIIYKLRFMSWANEPGPSPAQVCLRSAMYTIAAAVTARYQDICNSLYTESRLLLENLAGGQRSLPWTPRSIGLEQMQAWLLLAHYEILKAQEHQVVMTATNITHQILALRLHNIDALDSSFICSGDSGCHVQVSPCGQETDFSKIEEHRRVFWCAFILDRFLETWRKSPPTLQEAIVWARFPAPESNFQANRPIQMSFLHQVMENGTSDPSSTFGDTVLTAILYERCMMHRRLAIASVESETSSGDFWARHEWLANALSKRVTLCRQTLSSGAVYAESLTLSFLTRALAQSAIVSLSDTIGITLERNSQHPQHRLSIATQSRTTYEAALDIVHLAAELSHLGCFKVHPCVPYIIVHTIDFLVTQIRERSQPYNSSEGREATDRMIISLKAFKDIHGSARNYLENPTSKLDLGNTGPTLSATDHPCLSSEYDTFPAQII